MDIFPKVFLLFNLLRLALELLMKKLLLCAFTLLVISCRIAISEVKFAPYYSLQTDEGVAAPSLGDWMSR